MTTSVFYPAVTGNGSQSGDANSTVARAYTRELSVTPTIAERVFNSGTGTTMTSGTFTNTPTNGDVLIAVLARRADANLTSTNPTGWAKLTAAGVGGRTLEVWWYRSTGVAGDKGSFQWTTAAGTGAWGIELLRFGASAAYGDPVLKVAASNFAATTTPTAQTETPDATTEAPGMSLNCISITGTSLGTGGITAAFSGTGTADATTTYYNTTYGGMSVSINRLFSNADYASSPTYGTAFTLNASRAGHQAVIHLSAGGASLGSTSGGGTFVAAGVVTASYPGGLSQSYMTYDTSSIPDNNTVTSATLGVKAYTSTISNATLQARYYGTSITDTRGNNNNVWWLSPSAMSAKTLMASYAIAGGWVNNTNYALSSTASFASSINKTGNTVLIMTTDDYCNTTSRSSSETYIWQGNGTNAPLTVVHNYQATASAAASAGLTPAVSRLANAARAFAATINAIGTVIRSGTATAAISASLSASPTITRTVATFRTIASSFAGLPALVRQVAASRTATTSLTMTPATARTVNAFRTAVTSTDATSAVIRIIGVLRTIASTLTGVPSLVRSVGYTRTVNAISIFEPAVARFAAITRTAAATVTGSPVVTRTLAYLRTATSGLDLTATISRTSSTVRTMAATVTATPMVQRIANLTRQAAAIVTTIPGLVTSIIPYIVGIPRQVVLKVRSQVIVPVASQIRITQIRSTVILPIADRVRVMVRSLLRLMED